MPREARMRSNCVCISSRSRMTATHESSERQEARKETIISGNHVWLLSPLAIVWLALPPRCLANTGDKLRSGARVQPRRRGHEAALLSRNGAAESFVSFIPLFGGPYRPDDICATKAWISRRTSRSRVR
jgi:hypothetical protein